VDATCWANGRGYGRFAREMVRAMVAIAPDDEWILFADPLAEERIDIRAGNVRVVRVRQVTSPTVAAAADGSRSPADMLRFTRAVWREHPDVFFSPSVYSYFPLPPGLPAVVTIHDAIAERFPGLTLPSRRARLFWGLKVGLALRQARLVLTVSEYAARDIARVIGVPPGRIRVTVEAPAAAYRPSNVADIAAAAARVGLPEGASWFVYVGGFNPHKNVDTIVRSHAAISARRNGSSPYLLLVGAVQGDVFHGDQGRIRGAIAKAGTEGTVKWTGWLPDEELRHLLSGATALVLPSECEGFGLPAVEAAACGAPVIATVESPLPQVLEGGGIWVRPRDEMALSTAMRLLLDDPARRDALGRRALERAGALSWTRGARVALATLYEAAA
ncbi:MAG: glycosyltransferase family 4 protein, partial [Gemmatimonadota bacterium]|nr:glycosyltransferase family 4 protein [Gemmatimonadota bacterium]